VQGLQWWCQGTSFYQDTKVLTIGGYDMVLGADWLEDQEAMWIDWQNKIMKFKYKGNDVVLQGVRDDTS
jgi:hypothetical protein